MIEAALIGAGNRGFAYAAHALRRPDEIRFIAVADPSPEKCAAFAALHHIPTDKQFASSEQLLSLPKLCDAVMICTPDEKHYEPALQAMHKGYAVLLEKPMSPAPLESLLIAEASQQLNASLTVCHVLRYSTYFKTLKELIARPAIGNLISIQWTENVGFWHQAHSFVRGNWRNTKLSSPMILQKCCHDMDMLHWLIGSPCQQVSSFGSLAHYKKEQAPPGSTERCTDGCRIEHECPYSAIKLYYNEIDDWPQNTVTLKPDLALRMKALQEGPYGRCVYHCDNDVVDHQVVNMLFENKVTVAFTMSAFTNEINRTFKIMGTAGEIRGNHARNEIEITSFSGKKEMVHPEVVPGGHEGADTTIMQEFVKHVRDKTRSKSSGVESVQSHMIAFAAEHSRISGKTVILSDYVQALKDGVIS